MTETRSDAGLDLDGGALQHLARNPDPDSPTDIERSSGVSPCTSSLTTAGSIGLTR